MMQQVIMSRPFPGSSYLSLVLGSSNETENANFISISSALPTLFFFTLMILMSLAAKIHSTYLYLVFSEFGLDTLIMMNTC